MYKKLCKFWSDLDVNVKVNKRELVLGVALCTLTGLVTGLLCSPRKTITLGSNNGSNNIVARSADDEEPEKSENEE